MNWREKDMAKWEQQAKRGREKSMRMAQMEDEARRSKDVDSVIVCFGVGVLIFVAIGFGIFCYNDPSGIWILGIAVVAVLFFLGWRGGSGYGGYIGNDPLNPWDPNDPRDN